MKDVALILLWQVELIKPAILFGRALGKAAEIRRPLAAQSPAERLLGRRAQGLRRRHHNFATKESLNASTSRVG